MKNIKYRKSGFIRFIVSLPLFAAFISIADNGNMRKTLLNMFFYSLVIVSLFFLINYFRVNKKGNVQINDIDKMSGIDFENLLQDYFRFFGYKIHRTPVTGDFGADLILERNNITIVIQAKRWNSNVGVSAIQEITAAVKYYDAEKGMVITNSYFTPNAISLAKANKILLWDRIKLINIMNDYNRKKNAAISFRHR